MTTSVRLQWSNGPQTQGGVFGNWTIGGFFNLQLCEPSQKGNTIIGFFAVGPQGGPAANFAVTDDKGNSYTILIGGNSVGHDQTCYAFYSIGVAGGTRKLQIQNNDTIVHNSINADVGEWNSITAFDTSSTNVGTGSTAATAGSLTPSQTDDLLIQYIMRLTSTFSTYTSAVQANAAWLMAGADSLHFGNATQAGNYNSVAAITPQINMSVSGDWISIALAFKTGPAGAPRRSGLYVAGIAHYNLRNDVGALPNPGIFQMPTVGNLQVISSVTGAGVGHNQITAVSNSPGSTPWASVGPNIEHDSGAQIWYVKNSTPSVTNIITVSIDVTSDDFTYMIYDVVGAAVEPLDVGSVTSASGDQGAAGPITSYSVTTSGPNELIIANLGNGANTLIETSSPTGALFDAFYFDGEPSSGPAYCDENNGWTHVYAATAGSYTFTWTEWVSAAAQAWAGYAAAFKAASGPLPRLIYVMP